MTLDAALSLARQGFKVFPVEPRAKFPPLVQGWPAKATTDEEVIRQWWLVTPDANVGVHCDGLCVIDVDTRKGGDESLQGLELVEDLPVTRTARTPSGGRHLFYRLPTGVAGVPNSVGVLGVGLDIRSTSGYVIGAGSRVAGGVYAMDEAPIVEAPDWLVERLGAADARRPVAVLESHDADEHGVERAADWLKRQAPAVEGQGGDAHTFAVACGLRDRGVSEAQALTLLLTHWNDRCSPPWDEDELTAKVRNAYRYAQNPPGVKAAAAADFPVLDTPAETPRVRHTALRLSELASDSKPGADYVVKGMLNRESYASAYGPPGEGKTYAMLDIAWHVAAGRPWMGHKVRQGTVLYLAYEGIGGLAKRAKALRQRDAADVPLYVVAAAFNLREQAGRQELGAIVAELPEKPALVVLDTFARALMGGDENSAQDVGAFNSAVAALIEATGACVCIVHHSGKDKSKGARGSSALLGALDTEIEIDAGQIAAKKQRDVELGEAIGFALKPVAVGVDSDGDEVTSCVVVEATVQDEERGRISGNTKRGFDVLCEMAPDNSPVDPYAWRDACKEFLEGKNVAQRFFDIKKNLTLRGYIEADAKGMVTRRCE